MEMLVMGVVFGLVGFFLTLFAGSESNRNGSGQWPIVGFMGILCLIIALTMAQISGTGNVGNETLATGAIYETKSTVQDGDAFIVVLKHDDKFTCHRLKQQPPPVFKKTGDPKTPYQPYSR